MIIVWCFICVKESKNCSSKGYEGKVTINPEIEEVKILMTGEKFYLVFGKKLSEWQLLHTNEMWGQ